MCGCVNPPRLIKGCHKLLTADMIDDMNYTTDQLVFLAESSIDECVVLHRYHCAWKARSCPPCFPAPMPP